MPRLPARTRRQLETAIFYLTVPELRAATAKLGLSGSGLKKDLIARILAACDGTATTKTSDTRTPRAKYDPSVRYTLETRLMPENYRNNRKSREFLSKHLGRGFKFTTYGMDWVKQHWARGKYPAFREYIAFLKEESKRRAAGGEFTSKRELALVNYYRDRKGSASAHELREGWRTERAKQARIAIEILEAHFGIKGSRGESS